MIKKDKDVLSKEARRVYCSYMNRYLYLTTGNPSSYGSKVIPHYDGTSTGRPRPGEAIVHRSGRDYKPVWPKIANSAIKNDLSVIELIRSQFESAVDGPPSANSCHGQRAVRLAFSRREPAVQESANLLNSFKQIIDVSLSKHLQNLHTKQSAADAVLLCNIPSLCKVNIMMFMQLADFIPERDIAIAVEEYLLAPDIYDKAWGGSLHSEFEKAALRILKTKRNQCGINADTIVL